MMHNIYGSRAMSFHKAEDYRTAIRYYDTYLKLGKPGTAGYKFVEESLEYVEQELFMTGL